MLVKQIKMPYEISVSFAGFLLCSLCLQDEWFAIKKNLFSHVRFRLAQNKQ